jgi:Baseplate J-like protein
VTGSTPPIDYTNVGFEALRDSMLQLARDNLPEWTDFSENDLGVLLVELVAYACDITLYYQTRIAANLLPETSDEPEALVQLLRLIGYELRPPSPASAELRLGFAATEQTPIEIPAGTAFHASLPAGERAVFETVQALRIETAELTPPDPDTGLRHFSPVAVVEGSTQADDPVAVSDGSPNQTYRLRGRPVIERSIQVRVAEAGGVTRWREVETLADSTPADRDFVVRRSADGSARIVFGDGLNGMVPPAGTAAAPVFIRATYRTGGGPQGNLAAGTEFTPTLSAIRSATNPQAASGGAPAESHDRARAQAPRLFRSQERAVTEGDYRDLALQVAGVGKARAIALSWNQVVLYIAPSGQVAEPSETLMRDVLAFFERRRLATVAVDVVGPDAADVYLRATIQAHAYFLERDVRAAVEAAVAGYLDFDAVDFGQRLFISRVYDVIQDLPQVAGLTVTQFSRLPDGEIDGGGIIDAGASELPRPGYRDNPPPAPPGEPAPARVPIRLVVEGAVGA